VMQVIYTDLFIREVGLPE